MENAPAKRQGILYIVATPIGNLEDITARALRILGEADLVAAEDTRTTGMLLQHFGIKKPLISFFEHNETRRIDDIIQRLLSGAVVALVSEAGTPTISDPGFKLVREAVARGVKIVPIPGPTALIACLSASGLPTDRFAFEGFLPQKPGARKNKLATLAKEHRTLVFYESPYRAAKTLADMLEVFGDRRAVVGRELTKFHEEIARGTLSALAASFEARTPKGEFTIVVEGASEEAE